MNMALDFTPLNLAHPPLRDDKRAGAPTASKGIDLLQLAPGDRASKFGLTVSTFDKTRMLNTACGTDLHELCWIIH